MPPRRSSVEERFVAKVDKTDSCWLWMAHTNRDGYGCFWDGKQFKAHRWAYERYVGPIPEGLQLDHLCRVRHCVNPEHLEPVTQQENISRGQAGWAATRITHCPKGHEYSPENTHMRADRRRECRECMRARAREYYARHAVSA